LLSLGYVFVEDDTNYLNTQSVLPLPTRNL
jgi:hypothetical protein